MLFMCMHPEYFVCVDLPPAPAEAISVGAVAPNEARVEGVAADPGQACKEVDQEERLSPYLPVWFRRLMLWIGMLPQAVAGWGTVWKQPHVIFFCSSGAGLYTLLTNTCVLLIGSTPIRWDHHVPSVVYALCHLTSSIMMLRLGPAVAKTRYYNSVLVPAIFIQFALTVRVMLGPIDTVPFGNRLLYALVNSSAVWCWAFASTTGAWATDHPPRPFR